MKQGRPSIYTPQLGQKICERLAKGESIIKITSDPEMPGETTIYRWLLNSKEKSLDSFRADYAFARNMQLRKMHEEILTISDNPEIRKDKNAVNQARLQIDARKWYLSKVAPKLPKLKGTFSEQVDGIRDALEKCDINSDFAELLIKMVQSKAALAPVDEYKQQLDEIKEAVLKLNEKTNNKVK